MLNLRWFTALAALAALALASCGGGSSCGSSFGSGCGNGTGGGGGGGGGGAAGAALTATSVVGLIPSRRSQNATITADGCDAHNGLLAGHPGSFAPKSGG